MHLAKAERLLSEREWERCYAEATRAAELDPGLAGAWALKAAFLMNSHRSQAAIECADRALAIDPTLEPLTMIRGAAHLDLGQLDLALADLKRAVELEPRDARAWALMGRASLQKSDNAAARNYITKAIEVGADDASIWAQRALVRFYVGELDGALEDAARSLSLDPGNGTAFGVRGLVLDRRSDPAAIVELDKAIALQPANATWWIGRAQAHARAGHMDAARSDAENALAADPTVVKDPAYKAVLEQLEDAGK
jgi:tetratricopeptide (TPR) repeat protein